MLTNMGIGHGIDQACNTVVPSISGVKAGLSTITCNPNTWSGDPVFTYQWRRNGTNLSGQTNQTYLIPLLDGGQTFDCIVTATNGAGSVPVLSTSI